MRFDAAMNDTIRARVTPTEKRALFEAARKSGLTLSEFLRMTATDAARRVAA
ncbi:plasmid mobilization protein [Aminobacter aminovorans]|uniref:Uncharacterized protein (DUF1778 family) n=1 Tax=Aminobacter aminovorans TaxID=83263 RepID=A0AAC8YLC6_AMIAI|nr:DUF1778 domain-containing protein [Aminobacter aminovorans]AMS40507.1 hypothetical protein AA2016_1575 [Aminobacter aminovorans]MBB3706561.1 uncharacterized protein (DUF1778 family) [Aminobacter aminovorans]